MKQIMVYDGVDGEWKVQMFTGFIFVRLLGLIGGVHTVSYVRSCLCVGLWMAREIYEERNMSAGYMVYMFKSVVVCFSIYFKNKQSFRSNFPFRDCSIQ